jgi:hypothetical protein
MSVDIVEREFSPADDQHLFCAPAKRKASAGDRAQVSRFIPAVRGQAVAAELRLLPIAGEQGLRRVSLDVTRLAFAKRRAIVADDPDRDAGGATAEDRRACFVERALLRLFFLTSGSGPRGLPGPGGRHRRAVEAGGGGDREFRGVMAQELRASPIGSGAAMPNFSANLGFLFTELSFLDRFAAAARAAFRGVEYASPYGHSARDIARLLADHGLTQALFNLPAGDWDAGERGIAILPGREGEFRDGVSRALDYAGELGCARLNCLAGIAPPDVDRRALEETVVANLAFAAEAARGRRVQLLIEPINPRHAGLLPEPQR